MRKITIVLGATFCFFLLEIIFAHGISQRLTPEFLLLLIIFLNLSWGIRYSLVAAFFAGVLKDSLGITAFGFYTFSFVACCYLTVFIKRYIYRSGSGVSVILIVAVVSLTNFFLQYFLMLTTEDFPEKISLGTIFFPTVILTTLITLFVFRALRRCVLKLYV